MSAVLVGAAIAQALGVGGPAAYWGAATINSGLLAVAVGAGAALVGCSLGLTLAMSPELRIFRLVTFAIDMAASVPSLMLVGLLRLSDPERGLTGLWIGLMIRQSLEIAHFVRGRGTQLLSLPYVEVSRSMGASRRFQLRRHVLRALAAPMGIQLSITLASVLVMEAALTYLGLGMPTSTASLGWILRRHAPGTWPFVAGALSLTALCAVLNLMAWAISSPVRRRVRLGERLVEG